LTISTVTAPCCWNNQ